MSLWFSEKAQSATCQMVKFFLSVVQGYHQLYELHRARLEAQLLQMTEERDFWSQFTKRFAVKVQKANMSSYYSFFLLLCVVLSHMKESLCV